MLDFVDWLGSSLGAIVGFCVFTLTCFLGCLYTSCIPFIFLIQFAFTDKKKKLLVYYPITCITKLTLMQL